MEFVLPDPDGGGPEPVEGAMRGLLKRFSGYCLSGSAALQVAPLFRGTGANGKSTLVNVMRGIFGAYAQTLPVETLLVNDRKGGAGRRGARAARGGWGMTPLAPISQERFAARPQGIPGNATNLQPNGRASHW